MKERINNVLLEKQDNLKKMQTNGYIENLIEIVNLLSKTLNNGNKILIAGNGGSAADSQHFAAELVGRFMQERKALPAIALTTDSSILTCMGNDYGFEEIFSRQVEALGKKGDIFIGFSTSGNSENIIKAVSIAKKHDMITIGFLGKDGGKLLSLCDYNITFPYKETARIQEHHLMTYHLICEFVEQVMVMKNEEK